MFILSASRHPNSHAHSAQVSECFEPSILSTVVAIGDNFCEQLPTGSVRILGTDLTLSLTIQKQLAFLIGSFAANPWVSIQLEKRLLDLGLKVCKPDLHTWVTRSDDWPIFTLALHSDKAVAIGAVSLYVDTECLSVAKTERFVN